jgi:branched-chain amino acid transport system permease protein
MRPCGVVDETYQKDIAIIRTWQHWTIFLVALACLYALPLLGSYYLVSLINNLSLTIIIVLGLQIVSGYCGQISFGQVAFMAVGSYSSAILTSRFGLSFFIALPLSGVIAGIIGIIGGAPSLRMKEFYLAIATLAIHFVLMWLMLHMDFLGANRGLTCAAPSIGSFAFDTDERMYYLIISMMIIMTFGARNLVRSRIGRSFVAIRDNDLAAEVMGINLFYYKLLAFFISCFYAGIAGSLMAHQNLVVHPDQYTLLKAIEYVGMIIVGGMGSIPGVFFGVIFIVGLNEFVMFLTPILAGWMPWLGMAPTASLGVMAFGIVVSLFLLFEPRGVAHRWEIFKASYRLYPFARSI